MVQGSEDKQMCPLFTDFVTNSADKFSEVMGVDGDVVLIYFIECCIFGGLREIMYFLKFISGSKTSLSNNEHFPLFS